MVGVTLQYAATSVLVAFMLVSCGSSTEPEAQPGSVAVYVGQIDGTDARIALARDDARWAAYVCGGPSTLSSMTEWFQGGLGPAIDTGAEVQSNGKLLRVTFTEGTAMGSVVTGTEALFSASRVSVGATAGLFQLNERGCRSGLIVPPPGQGDPQGVYCANLDLGGNQMPTMYKQVNPLLPITLTDRGIASRVVGDSRTIYLTAVVLPLP